MRTRNGLCYFLNHGSCKLQPGRICDKCIDYNPHFIEQDPTNNNGQPGYARRQLYSKNQGGKENE